MPAPVLSPAITLKSVSYNLADGTSLFSDLTASFSAARTGLVGRNGIGKSTLLNLIAGRLSPTDGVIHVAGTYRMLDQDHARGAKTIAELFGISDALDRLDRIESGSTYANDLDLADWTLRQRLERALERAGLSDLEPTHRLDAMSGGQATRAALAALIFDEPHFLLLDEPTNNLDGGGRELVRSLLADWRGGALVVSHDRVLLNEMDLIAEITSQGLAFYGGNYDAYRAQKDAELAAASGAVARAETSLKQVERKVQQQVERKARKDARGKAHRARNDMPKLLLNGMRERAENTSGGASRLASRLQGDAAQNLDIARSRIEVLQPVKIDLPSSRLPGGKRVLTVSGLSGGYDDGPDVVRGVDLEVIGPERVGLVGDNGSGKSTLLALITGRLTSRSGSATVHVPYVMLDQRVSILDPALSARDNYLRLNPKDDENACRAALARFRFRGAASEKRVGEMSGGQVLGVGLACTLGASSPPQLVILDEPTNNLDLDALMALESGLTAYDGALLVVSHDAAFLDAIGVTRKVKLK